MKTKIRVLIMTGTFLFFSAFYAQKITAQSYISFQVFYDQLNPYGQWVDYPEYGYVWIPDAGPDFMPYASMGHWILTEYGWTWVSAYDWGWAPFHYGRWDYDNYFGWFWIPDNEWGPAWVSWRSADGYYGWEPMGPGITITLSFGREYDQRHDHWVFVRDRDFDREDLNHYYVNRSENARIVRNSTIINNTYTDNSRRTTYVTGPGRDDIQKGTGHRVNSVTIQEDSRPGQKLNNGNLRIYRPQMTRNNDRGQKASPTRLVNLKDVKQTDGRRNATRQENSVGTSKPETNHPSEGKVKIQQEDSQKYQNNSIRSTKPLRADKVQREESPKPQNNSIRSTKPVKEDKVQREESPKPQNNSIRSTKPVRSDKPESVKSTRKTVKPEKTERSDQTKKSRAGNERKK